MKNTASKPSHDGDNQRHTQPHRQPQPNPKPQQQPPATTAAPPPPAVVPLPRSESSDSVSSSSSSSWSTSLHGYGGGTVDSTSTSTSTAAFKSRGGKAAGRKRRRRQSDTTYPGRRKRSSSTDTGVRPEPQSRTSSKFWLYTVVAVVLTVATVSAIGMSLRGADTMTDEPQEYILPKRAKTAAPPPQCNCTNGSATNAANPDATAVLRRRLTSSEPELRRTTAESLDKSAAAAGGGNASAVERPDGAAPDDGVPQKKVAGKATRSFVAYKIGPGRRNHAGSSVTSQTPAIPNHTGSRPASQRPKKRGPQGAPTTSPGTLKNAPRRTEKTVAPTSASNTSHHPTLKTATYVMPEVEEAADWEQERPLVNEYGKRRSSSAAAGKPREVGGTPQVEASNAASRIAAAGTA